MGMFLATLRTPVNLFKGKIYEISGSQHTQKLNNRKEMRVKKNESQRRREWEEEARKPHKDFHLLQLKENITLKTSNFVSIFIPGFKNFFTTLESKCNFPHVRNAFDLCSNCAKFDIFDLSAYIFVNYSIKTLPVYFCSLLCFNCPLTPLRICDLFITVI